VTENSKHLMAAGAVWDDGPRAGSWIADRLWPFGPTVGNAVPLGYPVYAVVPLPSEDAPGAELGWPPIVDVLVTVLERFTGEQPVHCGMWDGWSWFMPPGRDPGAGIYIRPRSEPVETFDAETYQYTREQLDRIEYLRAAARERFEAEGARHPCVEPLRLPHRNYYLWTGPLRSVTAFRHEPHNPPSLVWPEDRSWFVGAPIYTNELAIAGPSALVDTLLANTQLNAYRASPNDALDIDD
jgi:hypothetical protein